MSARFALLGLILASSLTGCRCCSLLNPYANAIDDISDTHVYFDHWYKPQWDISRAGKPDWCGPVNQRMCPNICYLGCYDRYDECNQYPPANPYSFPSDTMGPPKNWTPTSAPVDTPLPAPTPPKPSPTLDE
jgi:hypothetical protein